MEMIKRYTACIIQLHVLFLTGFITDAMSITGSGDPLKYIASCELDLTDDGKPDVALFVETMRGRELIVLVKTDKGYDAHLLSQGGSFSKLSCHFGKFLNETLAGKGKQEKKVHKTRGTYIQLAQPEGAKVAYYWDGSKFREVWTAD